MTDAGPARVWPGVNDKPIACLSIVAETRDRLFIVTLPGPSSGLMVETSETQVMR